MIIMILGTIALQPGDPDALTFVQGKYVISQLTHSWKLSWLYVDLLSDAARISSLFRPPWVHYPS